MNMQKIINLAIVALLLIGMAAYLWLQLFYKPKEQLTPVTDLPNEAIEGEESPLSDVYDLEAYQDRSLSIGETVTTTTHGPLALTYDSIVSDSRCVDEFNCNMDDESMVVKVLISTMSETNQPYELTYEEPVTIENYTVTLVDFSNKQAGDAVLFEILPKAESN